MANAGGLGKPPATAQDRAALQKKFQEQPLSEHPSQWDSLWRSQTTPWDKGSYSPALRDAILTHPDLFDRTPRPEEKSSPRPRALIPGCGRGYDVLLLASLSYDAYGLDVSATAIAEAKEFASANPDLIASTAASNEDGIPPGKATFLAGDFWSSDWLAQTEPPVNTSVPLSQRYAFDLIFDFTFLCALPPSARPDWARRMSELLSPRGGKLICLEFPLGKPESSGGPPFGLKEEIYLDLLTKVEGGGKLKRLERWIPEKSHPDQQGKDAVSVWAHE